VTKLLLLLFSGAKFGKVLLTGGTMLLSVVAYSWLFGWWYAVGLVALIFVHEMGHYIAARRRGLNVGAPTFIPFVGAWIQLKDLPHDAETEAYVGLAGPFVGTLGALACFYLARELDNQLLLALSYAGFFINLFNLIPLSPLDGGRVTAVLSPKLWFVGAPILVAAFIYTQNPVLILIGILAVPQLMKAWRGHQTPEEHAYYNVSLETRMTYAVFYLGLLIFLAVMCHDLHQELPRTSSFLS
jgi:Zn-dependent protease